LTTVNGGGGTVVLTGSNSSAGTTTLTDGTLRLDSASNGGLASGTLTLGGGILEALNATRTVANNTLLTASATISGSQNLTFQTGTFTQSGNSVTLTSSITGGNTLTLSGKVYLSESATTRTLTLGGTGATAISGAIQGWSGGIGSACGLTKGGSGTLTLSGTNTYSGATTVNGGTLKAGIVSVGGTSGAFGNNSAVTMANNSAVVLDITGFNTQIGSLTGGGGTGGNVTLGSATLTVGGDNTSPGAYAGAISGTGGLTKMGSGTLTLTGTNTYTGVSTLSAGIVNLGIAEVVNTSGPLGKSLAANAGSIVLGGGTLQYSAANQNDYSGRFSTAASQQYKVDNNGQNVVWATALTSSGGILTKTGAGTLTLSGINTYSGTTTISGGTLLVNGNQAGASGAMTVNSGGTLGGIGTLGGAVTVNSGGTLRAGTNGLGTLTVTNGLSFSAGVFQVAATSTNACGLVRVTGGNVQIGSGSTIAISSSGYTAADGDVLWLISKESAGAISGTFTSLGPGAETNIGGRVFMPCYTANYATKALSGGNDLALVATSYGASWPYKMKITFSGYSKTEILTNFTALVVLNEGRTNFAYSQFASTNGYDLRFTDKQTNGLSHEIEKWDVTSNSYAWVRIPVFTNNCQIWAYWGNASASRQAYTTNGSTWDSQYRGVWHLHESTGIQRDSTRFGNHGVPTNGVTQGAVGIVDGADQFAGTDAGADQYLECGTNGIPRTDDPLTLEAWAKYPGTPGTENLLLIDNETSAAVQMGFRGPSTPTQTFFNTWLWNGATIVNSPLPGADAWHFYVFTFDGITNRLYVDGVRTASSTVAHQSGSATEVRINTASWAECFRGTIDEPRISSAARSSNRVWACWRNVASNDSFQVHGAASGRLIVSNDGGASNVLASSAKLNGRVVAGAPVPNAYIYWGPTNGNTNKTSWSNCIPMQAQNGLFSSNVASLTASKTYYYRCYVTNAAGQAWASASTNFITGQPSVSFSSTPYSVAEGGGGKLVTVTLSGPSTLSVSVNYATSNGTAVAGSDYTNTSGTLTWTAGQTGSKTLTVPIIDDPGDESDETFYVRLSSPANCTVSGANPAGVAIIDNDGMPTVNFAIASSSGPESAGSPTIQVALTLVHTQNVTVTCSIVGGTASNGVDYSLPVSLATITAGSTSTLVTLSITNDSLYEASETIMLRLTSPANAQLGLMTNHTYTIIDNDYVAPALDNGSGASAIFATSATLRGRVLTTGNAGNPTVRVFWGPTDGGTSKGSWSNSALIGSVGVGSFSTNISSLVEGTWYYYRCYGTNSGGETWASLSENFVAEDPPALSVLTNGGMETAGATGFDVAHWTRSDTNANQMERRNEYPRTSTYSMRYYTNTATAKCLYGVGSNYFRVSWNGQYAGGGTHPYGGIRPGFVLAGSCYTRARSAGAGVVQFTYRWLNVDDSSNWMSNSLATNSVAYKLLSMVNTNPVPVADLRDRYRAELKRDTAGSVDHHADDLAIEASLPRLYLSRLPATPYTFPDVLMGGYTNAYFGAKCTGGGAGTILYGAYVTDVADLTNAAWSKTAWYELSDPENAFSIISGSTLTAPNEGGWQYANIRFTPPHVGIFTGVVRIATTDPNSHYSGGGTIHGTIVYEEYTLIGSGVLTAPIVNNGGASNILMTSATLHGYVVSTGAVPGTQVSVYWGPANGGDKSSRVGTDEPAWPETDRTVLDSHQRVAGRNDLLVPVLRHEYCWPTLGHREHELHDTCRYGPRWDA